MGKSDQITAEKSDGERSARQTSRAKALLELHTELIKSTMNWAHDIPFYRDHWKNAAKGPVDLSLLASMPFVNKELYTKGYEHVFHPGLAPAQVSYSSGTTGSPTCRYRSSSEQKFVGNFFPALFRGSSHDGGTIPIVLILETGDHGSPMAMPSNAFTIRGALGNDALLEQAIDLLRKKYPIARSSGRISSIVGSISLFKILTMALIERGLKPAELRIDRLYSTGEYISKFWQDYIEKTWNSKIVNRYSLSEIFGGMTQCSECNHFHSDPHVIAECVDAISGNPIASGVGILVLTELYPFVQLQPLIRYWTDDLVRIARLNCSFGDVGYQFLGRRRDAIGIGQNGSAILILPTDLYETLDAEPLISKEEIFPQLRSVSHRRVGHPLAAAKVSEVSGGAPWEIEIEVNPIANPLVFSGEFERAFERIKRDLVDRSLELRRSVEEAAVSIVFRATVDATTPYETEAQNEVRRGVRKPV